MTGQRQVTAGVKGPLGEEADMAEITRQQTRLGREGQSLDDTLEELRDQGRVR